MPAYQTLDDVSCDNRCVLMRVDFNVPIKAGVITDDSRIRRALPGIKRIQATGGRVILMSHRGRPTPGTCAEADTLAPIAKRLSELLNCDVPLIVTDFTHPLPTEHAIILLENIRCLAGETDNDDALAQRMAAACDVFVMDAFATAHRAHASCDAVAQYAPEICLGPLFCEELNAISLAMTHPKKPLVAVVGGAKVSTKLPLLSALLDQVDTLIVGGGIANTLLVAAGYEVAASLVEPDYVEIAKELLAQAKSKGVSLPLPCDVITTTDIAAPDNAQEKSLQDIIPGDIIVDIGQKTQVIYADIISKAGTVVWNGPLGIFEIPAYSGGTKTLTHAIADSSAYSLAGGGDTLAALALFDKTAAMSYVSTGGGALLTVLQQKTLPILATIAKRQGVQHS